MLIPNSTLPFGAIWCLKYLGDLAITRLTDNLGINGGDIWLAGMDLIIRLCPVAVIQGFIEVLNWLLVQKSSCIGFVLILASIGGIPYVLEDEGGILDKQIKGSKAVSTATSQDNQSFVIQCLLSILHR